MTDASLEAIVSFKRFAAHVAGKGMNAGLNFQWGWVLPFYRRKIRKPIHNCRQSFLRCRALFFRTNTVDQAAAALFGFGLLIDNRATFIFQVLMPLL